MLDSVVQSPGQIIFELPLIPFLSLEKSTPGINPRPPWLFLMGTSKRFFSGIDWIHRTELSAP
jgi:hypothetical protein